MYWVLIFLVLFSTLEAAPLELSVTAESAILMNAKTGKILYEKNAFSPAYPASTTKIATALWALEKPEHLEKMIQVEREAVASITPEAKRQSNYRSPPYWLETDGSHAGIKRGEELSVYNLLHLMMIASANDAANVIAQGLGGTIPKYMDEVNQYLKSIGCLNTHFNNPHGLHHPEHTTTAFDLALMAKHGLKNPFFRELVSKVRYTCPETNLEAERQIAQTNLLLRRGAHFYPKAIGVKTGFTQTAGKNLVAAAKDENRELIAVALGYRGLRSELFRDVIKMFEQAFAESKMRRTLLPSGEQKLMLQIPTSAQILKTYTKENLAYEYYPSEEISVKATVNWHVPQLPITQGTSVGIIRLVDDEGTIYAQTELLALSDVHPTYRHRFLQFFSKNHLGRKTIFGGAAAIILFLFWKLRKKRALHR